MALGYSIEELIDFVQNDITIGCSLPKILPDTEIRRFVETRAKEWFYQNYQYAVSKQYYFLDRNAFSTEEYTRYKYIELPCEIQSISYVYQMRGDSLLQLGINTPNLSVNMGVTNQPYLSSYVTTIGELGVYKTLIDNLSDMMNQLNLYTTKFHFNYRTHRFNVLTNVKYHLILECYVNIPDEDLFTDPYFIKYVTGWAKWQMGNLTGRYSVQLPGGVTINNQDLTTQGQAEMKEVQDEIMGMSQGAFFFMVKR
ncbi:hypothetical protein EBU71_16330 [bacterium]|nr:hypothetical protein [Candidatus Elulimicrobium humile]